MNEKDEDEFYSTSIEYMRHLDLESKEFYPLLITIGLSCSIAFLQKDTPHKEYTHHHILA